MPKTAVNPPSLVKPVGYSHAFEVRGGRLLFLAGQVAFDTDGNVVGKGDLVAQFRQVCENLKTLVTSQGGTLQDIVKLNIYVLDKASYKASVKAIGQVYREYFGKHFPAMTLAEVKGLYDADAGCLIEIEGIAALD
jgi:enamine deaminase RidA (YjgF/YER057c/UK114 family)